MHRAADTEDAPRGRYRGQYFKNHERFKHPSDHVCHQCGFSFVGERGLSLHMSRMHRAADAEHPSDHVCHQCGFSFVGERGLSLHMSRMHRAADTEDAPRGRYRGQYFKNHERFKHPSDHVCHQCGFSFVGERGLSLHMSRMHRAADAESLDGPQCEECNIRFASSAAYEQHMKVSPKHAPAEKLKRNCPQRKFYIETIKQRTPKVVDCEQCGMQLVGARNYVWHFRKHHPGKNRTKYTSVNVLKMRHMCELCGKMMPSPRYHSPCHVHKEKLFKCDVCDKRFDNKYTLVKHTEIHSESRPRHECTVCGKNMSLACNLRRHMLSHKDTRIYYKCYICDKSFTTTQGRDEHVMHIHNNVPRPKRVRAPRSRPKTQTRVKDKLRTRESEES
ncbi:zinc finger protein 93 [Bicyclus anynana]|uniref:Zinc finger protein 93 n=1 Tax=Bicyclus anynana TaxID=110368 RepID=A0ABM3M3D6_BICAN|nr:zinc finger protein 93 [Bicyclus anynana]